MTGPSMNPPTEAVYGSPTMNAESTPQPPGSGGRLRRPSWFLRILLFVAGAGVLAWLAIRGKEWLPGLLRGVEAAGPWAPILFILVYAGATVLGMPGSILTLGAGALFGLVKGTVLASLGSTLGATAAFLLARHAAATWIRQRVPRGGAVERLNREVARSGWKIVLLTRLSPVLPFTLLNYAYGLTPVKTPHYIWGSWMGMLPGTVMYVYIGSTARALAESRQHTPGEWLLYGLGAAATLLITIWITRAARSALQQRQTELET